MDETKPEPPPAAPALPEPKLIRTRRSRLSLVWTVPILALVIGALLLMRSLLQAGPRIEIEFRTAEGLEKGKTEVRYKEVVIGRVESVALRDDRQRVVATVKLDRSAAGVAVEDSTFWVVRPRIGAGGVSGLGTLLSGAYIGVDAGTSAVTRTEFVGLESPPPHLRGEPGVNFVLRTADLGSLDVGSPIYHKRVRVGRVSGFELNPASGELAVKIFIEAPYQVLVNAVTRFWNASGIDLTLNASGLTIDTQTLASVLAGGIAFEQPVDAPALPPAERESHFWLYPDRKSALAPPAGQALKVAMVFDQSLRGLTPGAPLDFLGVEVGSVTAVELQYDAARKRYPVRVSADLYPLRFGAVRAALAPPGSDARGDIALLQRLVDSGLRAQARSGNLLTGQLFVALDFQPKAAPTKLKRSNGVLELPTVAGTLAELQPQVAQIVASLSKVPFEEIGRGLRDMLQQTGSTIAELTPALKGTLAETQRTLAGVQSMLQKLEPEAQKTLAEVQRTVGAAQVSIDKLNRGLLDEQAPLQRDIGQALSEFQRTLQSLRALTDLLQRRPDALLRGAPADAPLTNPGSKP